MRAANTIFSKMADTLMNPKISIIIPAYNEEKRISQMLKDYVPYAKKRDAEIIVVCDGTDKTPKVVKRFRGVRLIQFSTRLGKGGGVIAGFEAATGDLIGFADADNSISPEEFEKLVLAILKGSDCAVASRRISGSKIAESRSGLQRFGSRAINLLARLMFGLAVSDTQCGAKVFRSGAIKKVMPLKRSSGFEFDVELLWRIKNAGFSIKEVPVAWHGKSNSRFSMLECPKMLFNLILRRMGL